MSSDKGWIKVFRDIQDNDIWKEKPFSWGQAWIDLILSAQFQTTNVAEHYKFIKVGRGCVLTSIRKLCASWGWSFYQVRKYLDMLQNEGMIAVTSTENHTLIRVLKYAEYQGFSGSGGEDFNHFQSPSITSDQIQSDSITFDTHLEQLPIKKESKERKEIDAPAEPGSYTDEDTNEPGWTDNEGWGFD